jgi:hypothetical protein
MSHIALTQIIEALGENGWFAWMEGEVAFGKLASCFEICPRRATV